MDCEPEIEAQAQCQIVYLESSVPSIFGSSF